MRTSRQEDKENANDPLGVVQVCMRIKSETHSDSSFIDTRRRRRLEENVPPLSEVVINEIFFAKRDLAWPFN